MKRNSYLYDNNETIKATTSLPFGLFNLFYKEENTSAFIYDLGIDKCIYMAASIKAITGYLSTEYTNKGLHFFKTVIHPADYSKLICDIVTFLQAKKECVGSPARIPTKAVLCKMKHKKQSWVQTKINVVKLGHAQNGSKHKLIGYIEKTDLSSTNRNINVHPITAREQEVLKLIASGDSAKIIALKLNIGENTVISHRKSLKKKLNAKNSAELIRIAIKSDFV